MLLKSMNKKKLRKDILELRNNLSISELHDIDLAIFNNFKNISNLLIGKKCISIFLQIDKKREINTFLIIDFLKQNYPNIKICVPKSNFFNNTLTHYYYDENTIIEENNYGIKEPLNGILVNDYDIDIVIIPLLVADIKGFRLGYGKGFYDKFLSNNNIKAIKIGLSQFDLVDDIPEKNILDIPLDIIITTKKIYYI